MESPGVPADSPRKEVPGQRAKKGRGREGKMQQAGQKEAVDALGLEAAGPAGAHDLPFPSFSSKCEILLLILRGAFFLSTSTGTNGCFHAILSH